jgi:hypothetical protein
MCRFLCHSSQHILQLKRRKNRRYNTVNILVKIQRKHLKEQCFKNKSDLDDLACYYQDYEIYTAVHFAKFTGEAEN